MTQILFNRRNVQRHLQRAAQNAAMYDFLWAHAADALRERLRDIKRDFAQVAEINSSRHCVFDTKLCTEKGTTQLCRAAPLAAWCDDVDMVIDDEILPFAPASLDALICVNHMHWLNDVTGFLAQARRVLKPDGVFLCSFFGGASLHELRHALLATESTLTGGAAPRIAPMIDLYSFAALLQRVGFALPVADNDTLTLTYRDTRHLVHELRAMGQSLALQSHSLTPYLGKNFLPLLEENYRAAHALAGERIPVTVEMLYGLGWAPDASQPQPLKRGSALVSLEAVLKKT